MNEEVLWVVNVLVGTGFDCIDYAWFEVQQDCTRDVACIVRLVEENVFAVAAFGCKVFEVAILRDAVLEAELLPELAANWDVLVMAFDEIQARVLREYHCCHTGRLVLLLFLYR
jgi:hypothetical protein